jgi:phosphoribosylformimino-5-aminoimidazole carboxamide ribotide isomerase
MIEIIPAIDVIDGKCVRLSEGDFTTKVIYNENPSDVAKQFEAAGVSRLHVVDLDGARTGSVVNLNTLETIARDTSLTIDFSGGIKSDEDLHAVFDAGASIASVGSIAVKEPEKFTRWIEQYGANKFLLGADVRERKIAINGWQTPTDLEIVPFLTSYLSIGVDHVFVTDIAKDGLLQGPSNELYSEILKDLPGLGLIASGGVRNTSDIDELESIGCRGVIIGKALYEGRITLKDLRVYAG